MSIAKLMRVILSATDGPPGEASTGECIRELTRVDYGWFIGCTGCALSNQQLGDARCYFGNIALRVRVTQCPLEILQRGPWYARCKSRYAQVSHALFHPVDRRRSECGKEGAW